MKVFFIVISLLFSFISCTTTSSQSNEELLKRVEQLEKSNKAWNELGEKVQEMKKFNFRGNCLEYPATRYEDSPEKFKIITVGANSYQEAYKKLLEEVPSVIENTKIDNFIIKGIDDGSYSEYNSSLHKSKGRISKYETYNCKRFGEYYITAVIPKANVSYICPSVMPKFKGFLNVEWIKSYCKKRGANNAVLNLNRYSTSKASNGYLVKDDGILLGCGNVKVRGKTKEWQYYRETNKFKLTVLSSSGGSYWLHDFTFEYLLELEKLSIK